MEAKDLISHPSVQRELNRFRRLGGSAEVNINKITLYPNIIPTEIAEAFAERIRKLDKEGKLEVVVQDGA